ncbi:hypothetical protein FKM82_014085 [Ascaphus truei]
MAFFFWGYTGLRCVPIFFILPKIKCKYFLLLVNLSVPDFQYVAERAGTHPSRMRDRDMCQHRETPGPGRKNRDIWSPYVVGDIFLYLIFN